MTDQELKDLVARLAIKSEELDAYIKRTSEEQRRMSAETDAKIAETAAQMKRTDEKLERIGVLTGGIANSQGEVAEEFFFNSLAHDPTLAGIHYDYIDKHWKNRVGATEDEYDIILVNGQDIALIEVKYKAHDTDLTKLLTKKISNFKTLFPMYQNYAIHPVLASFSIYEDLKRSALEQGVIVLQRKGDVMESFIPG